MTSIGQSEDNAAQNQENFALGALNFRARNGVDLSVGLRDSESEQQLFGLTQKSNNQTIFVRFSIKMP